MKNRARTTCLVAALLLALTGCEAGVKTRIEVTGAESSTIRASVTFTDEAAEEITSTPEMEAQLVKLIAARTGEKDPEREHEDGRLSYSVDLPYDRLQSAQDILGVSAASLQGEGDDVTLTVELVEPAGLREAIERAAGEQPDAEALTAAMLGTTTVSVEAVFDGGVEEATGPVDVARTETTASVTQAVGEFTPGQLVVRGDPERSLLAKLTLPLLVTALLLVLLWAATSLRRRSAQRLEPRSLPQQ